MAVPIDGPDDRYRSTFEHSLNGIALHEIVLDDTGRPVDYVFLETNPAFERIIGLPSAELVGKTVTEVFPGIEKEPWIEIYGEVALTGNPAHFDRFSELLDKHFEVVAYRPGPGRFVTVFHDVTDHVAAKRALEESEAMRRSVVESSADHIMLIDLDGIIRFINRPAEGLTVEEVIGSRIHDHLETRWHAEMDECFSRVLETREPDRFEVEYEYGGGRIGYFESRVGPVLRDGVVVALTVSATDRTEHRELEEKLRQAQKMEAIGRLAGGLAHDFNNLLTGIKGFTHLSLGRDDLDAELDEDLRHIGALVDQAGDLTRQLLAFSRRQAVDLTVLDINALVEETHDMLSRLLGESFALEFNPEEELRLVRADRGQIQQVLMNLVVNARDAMRTGGRITVETGNQPAMAARGADWPALGDCARLTVLDDGPGIAPDALSHIFEPFYTTKGVGRGTGLGLATVYGIVKKHGGHIVATSGPSGGARFDAYFPAADEGETATEIGAREHESDGSGSETVLLVEDEDAVREVASRVLRARGYTVIEAADPAQAKRLFPMQPVDLLVSDVVMPGGDGPSLFRTLAQADPRLRVVYMSGYMDAAGIGDVAALGAPFLRKPFAPGELVETVRRSLDD